MPAEFIREVSKSEVFKLNFTNFYCEGKFVSQPEGRNLVNKDFRKMQTLSISARISDHKVTRLFVPRRYESSMVNQSGLKQAQMGIFVQLSVVNALVKRMRTDEPKT